MITKREKHLIAVLCGRTEKFGPNVMPAESREEEQDIDLTDSDVMYEVKALMKKLGNNLPILRQLMSDNNRFHEVFSKNVNSVLLRIAVLEKAKEVTASKAALKPQAKNNAIDTRNSVSKILSSKK